MFWGILFIGLIALSVLGIFYLSCRIRKYNYIKKLGFKGKLLSFLLPVAAIGLIFFIFRGNMFNAIIIILHLFVAILLCQLFGLIIHKLFRKEHRHAMEDISAVLLTVVYLGAGWFFAHHVFQTDYSFDTQKDIGNEGLRIVQISDSHLGVTLDGEEFAREMDKVQATNPDIVFITGDFVDDDSLKEDMLTACEALGNLNTKYGIYFVFGNHDEGYFNTRNFTAEELRNALEENGVRILEDETVLIDNRFYVVGREDRSYPGREHINTLTENLDKSKYIIVLDHQPNDYANEAAAEVDLVLSGHTHGGHIFPAGIIGVLMGSNDRAYGTERRNNTDFIVSSGISGWAIPFKTGTISEFVVIDIT